MINFITKLNGMIRQKIKEFYTDDLSIVMQDDFDWKLYNQHYRWELNEIQQVHTLRLSYDDYIFVDNSLVLQKQISPLHPNHRLLYETILQLHPQTIIEIGCGGGDHLNNLSILSASIDLYGLDLSNDQIAYLYERNPNLKANIQLFDITLPFSLRLPIVNIAYTQAVIMHLKTGNNHLIALSNLFKVAKDSVILMENWTAHHFMNDIQFLFDQCMLPWSDLYFYFRRSPELNGQPHLMIVSSSKLDYEELSDYKQLLNALTRD